MMQYNGRLTKRKENQVRAAMLYALLVTREVDPKHKNNGYDWLSGDEPETPQEINLTAVCGGTGLMRRD